MDIFKYGIVEGMIGGVKCHCCNDKHRAGCGAKRTRIKRYKTKAVRADIKAQDRRDQAQGE